MKEEFDFPDGLVKQVPLINTIGSKDNETSRSARCSSVLSRPEIRGSEDAESVHGRGRIGFDRIVHVASIGIVELWRSLYVSVWSTHYHPFAIMATWIPFSWPTH
jgi:hypothetical protein